MVGVLICDGAEMFPLRKHFKVFKDGGWGGGGVQHCQESCAEDAKMR